MREIMKLSLTLAAVAVLSAALLTGVHGITDPVIRERQEKEYLEALEAFFPAIESFETTEVDGNFYDLILDGDGERLGFMATVQTQGYEGAINYNLALDAEGEILGIRIISHSETPGIGDVIETEDFQAQFIGMDYDDPIQAGNDIDTVSGATISTTALTASVRRTVNVIGERFMGRIAEGVDLSDIEDGVYKGSVDGTYGIMTVAVEVTAGEITNIEIVEQNETDNYFVAAYPVVPEMIIAEQSLNIDTRTGATITSERMVEAVKRALSGDAGGDREGGDDTLDAE